MRRSRKEVTYTLSVQLCVSLCKVVNIKMVQSERTNPWKRSVKVTKLKHLAQGGQTAGQRKIKQYFPRLDLLYLCTPLPRHLLLVTSEQDTRPDGFLVSSGSTF